MSRRELARTRRLRRHGGGYLQRLMAFLGGMAVVLGLGAALLMGSAGVPVGRHSGQATAAPSGQAGGQGARSSGPAESLSFDGRNAIDVGFGKTPPAAAVLFDLDSGRVLWRHGAHAVHPVASTTKIMTALIAVGRTEPGEEVRVTDAMRDFSGSAVGLPRNKRVRVESLLTAMMVQSGNDAALALAIASEGSVRRFVAEMNRRAEALGLDCTRFVSPHGLESGNRSCAADLAVLARLAMQEPRIARVARLGPGSKVPWPAKGGKLHLAPTNPLLIDGYRGTIGLKTGYTEAAGMCLVAVVRREGHTLGAVLLDSPSSGTQAGKLLDAGFAELGAGGGGDRRRGRRGR